MSEIWTPERRALALAACRKWQGTPHVNGIAVPGVGIDCIKFVHEVLVEAQIIDRRDFGGYDITEGIHNVSDTLKKVVEATLHVEQIDTPSFGSLAVFRNGGIAGHCGFCDEENIWHALAGHVVSRGKIYLWRHRFDAIYRITEIGWKSEPQAATKI